jgi:hypothetical protein
MPDLLPDRISLHISLLMGMYRDDTLIVGYQPAGTSGCTTDKLLGIARLCRVGKDGLGDIRESVLLHLEPKEDCEHAKLVFIT